MKANNNNAMKKILIAIMMIGSLYTVAQDAAHGGQAGIYIYTPFQPCSAKRPNKDQAVKVKVERHKKGEADWQMIGYFASPESQTQLVQFYHQLYKYALAPEFTKADNLVPAWDNLNRNYSWDSLGILLFDRGVALALGNIYLDTTAQKGITYEYRLSEVKRDGSTFSPQVTNAVSYPGANQGLWKPKSGETQQDQFAIRVDFTIPAASKTKMFKIYRKLEPLGDYEVIENSTRYSSDKKSADMKLEVWDKSIGANLAYSYFVVAYDAYGNYSQNSDTVLTKTYEAKDVLTPQYLIAKSIANPKGIQLNWKLVNEMSVSGIQIFRSEDYEGEFTLVGFATPHDTSFLDANVQPAKLYYYYLQLTDRFQKNSFRSVRVFGMQEDINAPRPPRYVTAISEGGKVKVQWTTGDKNIEGYFVYRAIGLDTNYLLVSDMIAAGDSLTTWYDASPDLNSPYGYNYIVRQQNTSHVLSRPSQYAYVESVVKADQAPAVLKVEAKSIRGYAQLFWETQSGLAAVDGYRILRRIKDQGDFKPITSDLLPVSTNFYFDTAVQVGNVYEYTVQTVLNSGATSANGGIAEFCLSFSQPSAPTGLGLAKGKDGVNVTWNRGNAAPVKEFQLFRAEQGAKAEEKLATIPITFNAYTDAKASKGKAYFYYLIAVGFDGKESERSEVKFILVD